MGNREGIQSCTGLVWGMAHPQQGRPRWGSRALPLESPRTGRNGWTGYLEQNLQWWAQDFRLNKLAGILVHTEV